jgi:hypothetical protein
MVADNLAMVPLLAALCVAPGNAPGSAHPLRGGAGSAAESGPRALGRAQGGVLRAGAAAGQAAEPAHGLPPGAGATSESFSMSLAVAAAAAAGGRAVAGALGCPSMHLLFMALATLALSLLLRAAHRRVLAGHAAARGPFAGGRWAQHTGS